MRAGRRKDVWFSDDNWEKINRKSELLGVTPMEYVRQCIDKNIIVKIVIPDLKELIFEINKIGTNINQIAHKVNIVDDVSKIDLEILLVKVEESYTLLNKDLYSKLDNIRKDYD